MIQIVFPPGCYGHFLARCLFGLTDLDPAPFEDFEFDHAGSSHCLRDNDAISRSVSWCHAEDAYDAEVCNVIVLLPEQDHMLDYYLNQFVKQQENDLIRHLALQVTNSEITDKITTHWPVAIGDINEVPRWIMREWFSLWIQDCVQNGYDRSRYESVRCAVALGTNELFDDLVGAMHRICDRVGLQIRVTDDVIMRQQRLFTDSQKFHGHQQRCSDWCQTVIKSDQDHEIQLHTIFDEAWIQHTLRQLGHELRCDGLDTFPTSSVKMKELTYPK